MRTAVSKVMWVGRATVFMVGLAVILALVFGVATTAMGANGKPFLLGKKNVASAISTLVKQGPGPALKLQVGAGQPPLAVNSKARVANLNAATAGRADSAASAGFATNALNADKVDGKDSTAFLGSSVKSRTAQVSVADGSFNSLNLGCNAGESLIGGGAALGSFVNDVHIISSRPEPGTEGQPFGQWRASAANPAGGSGAVNLRVFAVCVD